MSFGFNLRTIVRRGVFDLGPYGIKFALADVDLYHSKISELYYYAKSAPGYLSSSFKADAIDSAVNTIKAYKLNAESQFSSSGKIEFFGIAREPFTKIKDGKKLLDEISLQTGVRVTTISAQEEKKLAYNSLQVVLGRKIEKSIVFNITSDSTALIDGQGSYEIEVTCKKFYELVKKETRNREHIYPLESRHVKQLIDLAMDLVQIDENLTKRIQSQLKIGFSVVGRGAIHNHVAQHYCNLYEFIKIITQKIDASFYTKQQLNDVIKLISTRDLTRAIGLMHDITKYEQAEQELTNLMLIYAIMCKAGINKVHTVNAKNIFGLLVQTL